MDNGVFYNESFGFGGYFPRANHFDAANMYWAKFGRLGED